MTVDIIRVRWYLLMRDIQTTKKGRSGRQFLALAGTSTVHKSQFDANVLGLERQHMMRFVSLVQNHNEQSARLYARICFLLLISLLYR